MQIVRDLAGYSLGRSDLMRRAMAKKKHDVMAQEREYFVNGMTDEDGNVTIDGAVRRGVPREVAQHIFDEMTSFASYAFNKSHAAAYGVVAVQTGWLKLHYPVQFMAAIMNSVMDNAGKVAAYIQYCRAHDIPLLPPDVNKSLWKFSVDPAEHGIRFGLGGVKNVGRGAVELMVHQRENGLYSDIFDFVERTSGDAINKRTVESLIKAGAFDRLGHNRAQLLSVYERLMDDATQKRRSNVAGQTSLFDLALGGAAVAPKFVIPDMPEHNHKALLTMEKDMTGVYITGHPLDEVADLLSAGFLTVSEVEDMAQSETNGLEHDGMNVTMAGILTLCRGKLTKKGAMMGFITLEDLTGQIEGLVFPKIYEKYLPQLMADSLVMLDGKLSFREEEEPKLLVDTVRPLTQQTVEERKSLLKSGRARGQSAYGASGDYHAPDPFDMGAPPDEPAAPKPRRISGVASDAVVATQQKNSTPAADALTDAQLAKRAEKRLYLLVPERAELDNVKTVCAANTGDVPVTVKLQSEGIALLLNREYWVDASNGLLDAFRARYGENGVVLKQQ